MKKVGNKLYVDFDDFLNFKDDSISYYLYENNLTLKKLKELNIFRIYQYLGDYYIVLKTDIKNYNNGALIFFKNENEYFDDDGYLYVNGYKVEVTYDEYGEIYPNEKQYEYALKQPPLIIKDDDDKFVFSISHKSKKLLNGISKEIMMKTDAILLNDEMFDKIIDLDDKNEETNYIYNYLKYLNINNDFIKKQDEIYYSYLAKNEFHHSIYPYNHNLTIEDLEKSDKLIIKLIDDQYYISLVDEQRFDDLINCPYIYYSNDDYEDERYFIEYDKYGNQIKHKIEHVSYIDGEGNLYDNEEDYYKAMGINGEDEEDEEADNDIYSIECKDLEYLNKIKFQIINELNILMLGNEDEDVLFLTFNDDDNNDKEVYKRLKERNIDCEFVRNFERNQ